MAEKKDDDATEKARLDKYRYIDVGALNDAQIKELVDCPDPKSTMKKIEKYEVKRSEWKKEDWLKPAPLSFVEELTCIAIFLFVIPCAALFLPIVVGLIFHYYGWKVGTAITVILAASTMKLPKFSMNALQSWQSVSFLRYFSFKGSFAQKLDLSKPYILVAPPHGVFPFGNLLTMIAFPYICGYPFKGLAASAVFKVPLFGHVMSLIGVIDAGRSSAEKHLKQGHTLGISTGGVSEVFETNTVTGDEAIVLKERIGLIKLAVRTGTPLVPCYLFGNTKLYSMWTGGAGSDMNEYLRTISRKLGFATIMFWGRFGLPVPYRIPIIGCMGPPIEVEKQDNPSKEYLQKLMDELCVAMEVIFDDNKEYYGWGDRRLLVK